MQERANMSEEAVTAEVREDLARDLVPQLASVASLVSTVPLLLSLPCPAV
jgi:hypothetical protein